MKVKQVSVIVPNANNTAERPENDYDTYRAISRADPLVGGGIRDHVIYVLGKGFRVRFKYRYTGEEIQPIDVPEFFDTLYRSKPITTIAAFIKDGLSLGDGYLELVREGTDDPMQPIHKFINIPVDNMQIVRDKFGNVTAYEMKTSGTDVVTYKPENVVHYKHNPNTGSPYGISDVEAIAEYVEIMRGMSFDMAKFIATKALPPLLWSFGTPEDPWNEEEIRTFLARRATPDPGDNIGVGADVTVDAVGVAKDTLNVEPYLKFFAALIVNGLGIPAANTSIITDVSAFTAEAQENAYSRRINWLRTVIGELLETELFDRILASHGYDDVVTQIIWIKHDAEEDRVKVNNEVALVQNNIESPQTAQDELGKPIEQVDNVQGVDQPERSPNVEQPDARNNTRSDMTGTSDGRTGKKQKAFKPYSN